MRIAHFDCFSGISGDMTVSALLDVGVPAQAILDGIASLKLPIQIEIEKVKKSGLAATYLHIEAPKETTHRFLPQIEEIVSRGSLSASQKTLALKIFRRLAEAEAAVHGIAIDKVHFHEVGALDSIADVVGAAIGLDLLGVERFTSAPVPTGTGMVQCAHGSMPIPAPATAQLLKGVPLRSTNIQAELTTPTGAAILTSVVSEWIESPTMTIERIGCGAGKRELVEQPNILRLFVGQAHGQRPVGPSDKIWVLETNLDDLPAEVIGYCYDQLFAAGALDVFSTPIYMKKNRPGVLLSVLAAEQNLHSLEEILFRETTTLGVRRYSAERHKLNREAITVSTLWGPVKGKKAWMAGRPPVFSPEYEDCARIAREQRIPLRDVIAAVQREYKPE